MILRSIHVEGWRCFIAPVRVGPFSDGLNVLYAPNATGKSTLFEALLRGLLDSYRVTGREVEALRPWGRFLAPAVSVEFTHGGTDYRLTKRFLDRPSSNLERRENGRFVRLAEGEAADQQVREILTHNPPGRGLARPENWGLAQVLWAPQGDLALAELSGDVVSNIREFLGVQISGPGAGLLEERIEDAYLKVYTPGGRLKTGKDASALVRLREQLQQAIENRGYALEQQQAFEEAAADEIRRAFIAAVEDAETAWESTQNAFTAASTQKATLGVKLEETEKQMRSLETRLTDLTSDGRMDEERETELRKLALAWDAATAALKASKEKLQAFGEDPRVTVTKLEKQRHSAEDEATKALEAEKIEEGRLGQLAAQGPYSALTQAEEEVTTLKEEVAREELRTSAVRLLRDTVTQCRAEALAAVVGPVQLAATRTLQRIAGRRLGGIQLGETFAPAHVLPQLTEIPVPLDDVSGGEREQIYLATRLALAEVLAKEERQLVVLDDVLTATDAGRLARVLTVLEEAAQRLQVLIITCHPERYRGLDGAQFFDLEAILPDNAAA